MTALQKKIVAAVKERLQTRPWFKGVCVDQLPSNDRDILGKEKDFIDILSDDTWYHDSPDSPVNKKDASLSDNPFGSVSCDPRDRT